MTVRSLIGLGLAALPLAGAASPVAAAEERDPFALRPAGPLLREDVAGARTVPGYGATGVKLGALTVYPVVNLRAEADSNVLNSKANREADVALTLAPSLRAEGESAGLRYVLSAGAGAVRYARLRGQDHETFEFEARGALPLGGVLTLGASAGYARRHEPNASPGASAAGGGATLYNQLTGSLGTRAELGKTRIEAKFDYDRFAYRPVRLASGLAAEQSFRDQQVLSVALRGERALPGGRILFTQGTLRTATSLRPAACCERGSRGGEVVAGVRGDLTGLVAVELAGGWQWRNFRAAQVADWRGASWRARVDWYATPLVSLSFSARRDIIDAGVPTAAGVVVDSARITLFHEARRNLNFTLSAGAAREKYRDPLASNPVARTVSAGAEARYALSSRYLVGAYARYRNRSSDSTRLPRLGGAAEGGLWLRVQV